MHGLNLAEGDATPAVVRGRESISVGDIGALAASMQQALRQIRADSVIAFTEDPARILAAIDVADRNGIDLYIAHTTIPGEHIASIVQEARIAARLDDAGISATGITDTPGAASGAIHLMTSGTSGSPKIARHSLGTLLRRIVAGRARATTEQERWLLTFQPTGFAGVQVQLSALTSRGAVVVPAERTPAGFHQAVVSSGVTHVSATPTFWRSLLMLLRPGEVRLRQVTLGGEGADQAILDRLRHHFPEARITHTYASTEAGVVFAVHDGLSGFPAAWLDSAIQGVELRLRDGFLQIRTAARMHAYASGHAQPLLDDGWLGTTDRCVVEGDRVRILGRDDAMINVAGSKVYPAAVEAVLLSIAGVTEARVYGVPNPIAGAIVAADVVLAPGQDPATARSAIMAACRERLAGYQLPRALKFVDSIRVNASGKKAIQ